MKQVYIFLVIIGLNACASLYNIEPSKPVAIYKRPIEISNSFNLSGRFTIKTSDKNNYGNFRWSKESSIEELDLNSPLGQTLVKIVIERGNANLTTKGQTYSGEDLDEMMLEKLGFTLPLNYLHYWIQGVEIPNELPIEILPNGFIQLGWRVEYLEWQDQTHAKIIMCSRENLIIKLLLDW
ncbi:MAG TPA: outer membrane lipoprotein LolB [Burkholderiales bacterium]|nr:outer membrane lipoprotein LolB [Burkholderiales bacterium]